MRVAESSCWGENGHLICGFSGARNAGRVELLLRSQYPARGLDEPCHPPSIALRAGAARCFTVSLPPPSYHGPAVVVVVR